MEQQEVDSPEICHVREEEEFPLDTAQVSGSYDFHLFKLLLNEHNNH